MVRNRTQAIGTDGTAHVTAAIQNTRQHAGIHLLPHFQGSQAGDQVVHAMHKQGNRAKQNQNHIPQAAVDHHQHASQTHGRDSIENTGTGSKGFDFLFK